MRRKAHEHEHEAELNIVPYLDIIVNLVMFMLVSMSGFVMFQMINTNMPDLSDAPGASATPPPEEKQLTLTVLISTKGYFIAATGGILPGDIAANPDPNDHTAAPTIPLKPNEKGVLDYDYKTLTTKMTEIKEKFPAVSNYLITADKTIKYDVIVHTMDATRGTAQNRLFPDVTFAAIM